MCLTSSSMNSGLPPDSRADHVRLGSRHRVVTPQQGQRQLACLGLRERLDGQLAMVERDRLRRRSTCGSRARNGLRSASSERKQPMNSKTGDCGEQSRSESRIALSTSPHWRSSIARISGVRSPSRFSSSRSPAKARRRSSCWSGISGAGRRADGDGFDALQHRKHPGQKRHVLRQQALRLAGRQPLQVPRQGVDQAVERLVRDRFSLVAPAREDDGLVLLDQLVEERSNQRGLAGPRPAEDEDRLGLAAVERGEQACRGPGDAATARSGEAGGSSSGTSIELGDPAAQLRDDFTPGRPLGRVSVEERDAEPHQVLRQPVDQRVRRRRRPGSAWRAMTSSAASRQTAAGRSWPRRA